jgi:diacylglycerol kinase family enzyme
VAEDARSGVTLIECSYGARRSGARLAPGPAIGRGAGVTHPADRPGIAQRACAALALVLLGGAIAALVAGAIVNWASILAALAGLVVAVAAGWYAVSRRGAVRAVAAVLAAAAAALLGLGLALADIWLPRVLLTVACAAGSVGCARLALHRGRGATQAAARPPAAARPRHPVLIMNPRSGGGKATRFQLADECRARGIEPVVLQPGDDLLLLAEAAISGGADAIGMAGGDGSQALVAAVAARHGIPHVTVPAGTRNHFALDLGLDRDDVVGALDAFTDGIERRIDLAEVNGRVFVNNASLGLYAEVVQSPEYRDAKLKTAADILPRLLGPDAAPLDLRFTGPGGTEYPTAHLILVSNNPYQLDYIGGRGTRERLDLGVLGLVATRITGPAQAQRFIALEAVGQLRRFPGWMEWQAPRFEVGSAGPLHIGIDGEAVVLDPPLRFTVRAGALRVLLPRRRLRQSPAAAALHLTSRSVLADLAGIAAGRIGR